MTTPYLTLTPSQSRDLATTGRVAVWERMKDQPPADAIEVFSWFAGDLRNAPNGCAEDGLYFRTPRGLRHIGTAPHPPGTRATVNTGTPTQAGGVTVRVGAIVRLTATSCTPERRDEWGWLTVWQHEGSK
jgi:hypothetical protein